MRSRIVIFLVVTLTACATSPLGRSQLHLYPDEVIEQMGITAYEETKRATPIARVPADNEYVNCIATALIVELPQSDRAADWEVTLFRSDAANAFALPGGKIGVYTGMFEVAETEGQLATVVAHEIAHVIADHANERMSTQFAAQAGLDILESLSGASTPTQQRALAALGLGAQVGILLPFSREQEREADLVGLDMMARAGFDPRQSIQLWKNMERGGGPAPPEFLSTHPSRDQRIAELTQRMPEALVLFAAARAADKRPRCSR